MVSVKPPEPPKPIKPKPSLSLDAVRQSVLSLAQSYRCAAITPTVSNNRLYVSGYVATDEDRQRLMTSIDGLEAPHAPLVKIDVEPWPACEVLGTFSEPLASPKGLTLSVDKNPLKNGNALRIELTTPKFPSYIYVSYIQADGQVVHLHRYSDNGGKPFSPNAHITLGDRGEYVISGPTFGHEMLVAIASPKPLLVIDRPQTETDRQYLTEFRLALLAHKKIKSDWAASAAITTIVTEP